MTRYAVLFLALLTACSGGEKPSTQADPSISVFTAAPATLAKGGSTKLIFAAQDADTLALDNGIGDVTGKTEVDVTPAETTTYTLTASRGAKSAQSKLTVTVGPTPAAGFKLVAAGTLTAGEPADISVTAVDAAGAAVPSYAGTVHLMSNDEKAELPADFTFGAEDKGVKTVRVTFKTAGPHALVASGTVGGGMTGSFSATSDALTVRPGAVKELRLSGLPAETESGMEATLTVSFVDAFGNAVTDYPGTLRITTSDDSAPAIPDVQLSAPGSASAKVTFFKAGVQTVTVQDSADASLKASAEVRVKPSTAAAYVLSALPASTRAGEPLALTVTALDSKGNRAQRYAGKVHFTSTDAAAQLPADASFDEGVASVSVSFRTAGNHTLTASEVDGTLKVTSDSVGVAAGAARTMVLTGLPVESEPGTELSFQVFFADAFGNPATDHRGTLRFTLSDSRAPALPDVTLTDVGNGSATAQVTFATAGLQTVTVQDLGDSTLKATAQVRVKAGAAVAYSLSALPASARAGEPLALTVTALDSKGNVAVGYTGKVHFTSTDAAAQLPADASFSQGVASVSVAFHTAGSQSVTATEVAGSLTETTGSVSVSPGAARVVRLSGLPAETESGTALSLQASLEDAFGNPALDTASTLHISNSDDSAPAVADVVVANATASFSVTFLKAGVQTLTVQDTGNAALKASANVRVNPAAAAKYVLSALPASAHAGEALPLTVTVLDAQGNRAVGYSGKVHFTSTDAAAQLPADASFSQGVATVSVAFHSAGSHTLTAAEVAGGLSETSNIVAVKADAARTVRLTGLPPETEPGMELTLQVAFLDAFGNLVTDHAGTVHVTNSDESAPAIADVAVSGGTATVKVTFFQAGVQTLTVQDTDESSLTASKDVRVHPGAAASYSLSALPGSARAGESLALTVTALDSKGNRVLNYSGRVRLSSTDAAAQLPADAAFDQGVASVSVAFHTAGTQTVTATEVGSTLSTQSNAVDVKAGAARAVRLSGLPSESEPGTESSLQASLVDAFGNLATDYTGTLHFTLSDAGAPALSDAAASNGSVTVKVSFVTAGLQTVTVQDTVDATLKATAEVRVKAGAAVAYSLSALPASARAGDPVALTVTALDSKGNRALGYSGKVHFTSTDAAAQLPADAAFTQGVATVSVSFRTAGSFTVTASEVDGSLTSTTGAVTVKPGAAHAVRISGLVAETESGLEQPFQVSLFDAYGNAATDYAGTLRFTLTDPSAAAIPDLVLTAANNGTATAKVTFIEGTVQSVTVRDVAGTLVAATAKVWVKPISAAGYVLSALPATVRAGDPVALTVTAVDRDGKRAYGYSGRAYFTSTDAAAQLPVDTTFNQGLANVMVTFRTAGNFTVTATELGGTLKVTSSPVAVTPGNPASILVAGAGTVTAGNAASLTATVKDAFGNTVTGYGGTVSLTSSDAQADGLVAYTFTAADAGVHAFSVTLKTAGAQTVTLADGAVTGTGSFTVSAADVASCAFSEVPASVVAGSTFSVRVSMKDAFGNAAVTYGGTVSFSSTDSHPAAVLPEATAYVPGQDGGSRRFNVKLVTGGTQTLTAKDASNLTCTASLTVTPSAARLVVALPTDVNAGSPAAVTVTAQDTFGNVQLTYAGTVSFTSTDTAAVLPGSLTFTGSENGTKTASVTFNTLGAQKLTATQVGDASVTGTGSTAVHGFVYTDPTAGLGKVRLVLNASKSSASVVQLDLVSNTTVTATSGGSIPARGGVYSAGMNLPLDTSRAVADSTLLVEGTQFSLGTAPKAVAAALPTSGATAGVLYSGVSQKFGGAGAAMGDTTLIPGRIFYSVRLKLPSTATVGTVFDGANLGNLNTKFRAAVRNRAGDDVLSTDDFLLGKLEVR